jgi:hypothetical protein
MTKETSAVPCASQPDGAQTVAQFGCWLSFCDRWWGSRFDDSSPAEMDISAYDTHGYMVDHGCRSRPCCFSHFFHLFNGSSVRILFRRRFYIARLGFKEFERFERCCNQDTSKYEVRHSHQKTQIEFRWFFPLPGSLSTAYQRKIGCQPSRYHPWPEVLAHYRTFEAPSFTVS